MQDIETTKRALLARTLVLASAASACVSTSDATPSQRGDVRVVDELLDAYRSMNVEAMMRCLAEELYFEDPTFHLRAQGREQMRRDIIEPAAAVFANVSIEPFNRVQAFHWVIVQQRLGGSMRRPDGSMRQIDVQGLSMFEVRERLIVRWYDYYDVLTFRSQMAGDEGP